jgi:hypothetical protein
MGYNPGTGSKMLSRTHTRSHLYLWYSLSTSRMTQEDHDDAMDTATENMNARDMTVDINQDTTTPVLEYLPPLRHVG